MSSKTDAPAVVRPDTDSKMALAGLTKVSENKYGKAENKLINIHEAATIRMPSLLLRLSGFSLNLYFHDKMPHIMVILPALRSAEPSPELKYHDTGKHSNIAIPNTMSNTPITFDMGCKLIILSE